MIREQAGRFYIGNTDKWFSTRARAQAFLAKGKPAGRSSAAPPARVEARARPVVADWGESPHAIAQRKHDDDYFESQRAVLRRADDGAGRNLKIGATVRAREDVGARWEEETGEIVSGPFHKGKDVRWGVAFAYEDGMNDMEPDADQVISAINLTLA